MKKTLFILFTLQIFITSLFGTVLVENIKFNEVFYDNSTDIMISIDGVYDIDNFGMKLNEVAENNNIYINRKIYTKENALLVYATDVTLNNKINLKEGEFPKFNNEYISNRKHNDLKQVGFIENLSRDSEIAIQHMNNIENLGVAGLYSISSTDSDIIETVINDILKINNTNLRIEVIGTYHQSSFLNLLNNGSIYSFMNNLLILIILPCVILSILLLNAFYVNRNVKSSYIYLIHGYSREKICIKYMLKILKSLVFSAIFSISCLIIINSLFIKMHEEIILIVSIIPTLLFIMIYSTYYYVLSYFSLTKKNLITVLKGKKNYKFITIMQYLTKFIFTLIFFVLLFNVTTIYKEVNLKVDNLSTWMNTQNIYQTTLNAVGDDFKTELQSAEIIKEVTSNLIEHNNAFMCNVDNYEQVDLTGKYIYELNGRNGYPIDVSPNGTAITVSENYFNINPIQGITNQPIQEQINYDDNTLNILVPIERKNNEELIKEAFRKDFWFKKVQIDNMYNEELGKPVNNIKEEDLNINIIYVKNNQEYFTFNSAIEANNQNKILDPIVIIYTDNIHSSFMLSAYSSNFYFYSDKIDPFDSILPILVDKNALNLSSSIIPLYDQYGKEVNELKVVRNNIIILIIIIFIANIVILYSLMLVHYEKNKYKLYLKKVLGFTFINKNKFIILLSIVMMLVPLIWFILAKKIIFSIFVLGYLIFEYSIIFALDRLIGNESFNSIIKGEH